MAALVDEYAARVVVNHKQPEMFDGYMRRAVLPILGKRMVRDVTFRSFNELRRTTG